MEKTEIVKHSPAGEEERRDDIQELLLTLPKAIAFDGVDHCLYEGFWIPEAVIESIISFQRHFEAHDSDLILATAIKAGTTWLKALTFSVVNRTRYNFTESPLLTTNPHELVPFLEIGIYLKNLPPNLENLPTPRMLSTHVPFELLPDSIKNSNCRIVYLCRNPLDLFNSYWHFNTKVQPFWESLGAVQMEPMSLDEGFDLFCRGISGNGPFWNHMLGYWKASLERPDKVLFLKYEDLKEDINFHSKRLAEFLGFPFTMEEEQQGVIEELAKLCSFENLKVMEVNKTGIFRRGVQNSVFFRKGEVGDWANYLTPTMVERMKKLMEEQFCGSGLSFKV